MVAVGLCAIVRRSVSLSEELCTLKSSTGSFKFVVQ